MKKQISQSIKMLVVLTILTGLLYPLLITAIAQIIFPHRANGSIIIKNGTPVGSELIGQNFKSDKYFLSRPSAIDYNPMPSGGSNLSPTSNTLRWLVLQRKQDFIEKNHLPPETVVPNEMLFASGSGLDPHISPDAAMLQVDRIAKARGYGDQKAIWLKNIIHEHIEFPQLRFLGEQRVNVLRLNIVLDQ
jgi:potassium-transporting ATPase KdpC subunit